MGKPVMTEEEARKEFQKQLNDFKKTDIHYILNGKFYDDCNNWYFENKCEVINQEKYTQLIKNELCKNDLLEIFTNILKFQSQYRREVNMKIDDIMKKMGDEILINNDNKLTTIGNVVAYQCIRSMDATNILTLNDIIKSLSQNWEQMVNNIAPPMLNVISRQAIFRTRIKDHYRPVFEKAGKHVSKYEYRPGVVGENEIREYLHENSFLKEKISDKAKVNFESFISGKLPAEQVVTLLEEIRSWFWLQYLESQE